ncbi:MAG TPA: lysophospholipid acyltransferase family protein [Chitinophagaceae bacterium]|nr:lysophospholipid acyltransferase family protein [Chitinophagaceae bacterium]
MNLFKNIFGRIWAVWGMLLFIATLLIVLIPFLLTGSLPEPRRTAAFRRISKVWMTVYLHLIGCPVRVKGASNFKKGQAYVVVCNHNSLMDVPLSTPFIPGPNKTIAKIEMAKIPLFGLVYKRGSVLVDRKSDESRRKSLEDMKAVLAQGMHMCIYPEGTRNKTGQPLKSFYEGAFKLASDTATPIIPALIFNTGKVLPNNKSFFLWPHALSIHFLEPVMVRRGEDASALKDKLYTIMWDYLVKSKKQKGEKLNGA